MDAEFWHRIWREGRTGFHLPGANPFLRRHLGALGLSPGARVFLPLCGKTRDIGWLLGQGFRVAGVELSLLAVDALFEELGVAPEVSEVGGLRRYRAEGVEIWQGDLFDLTPALLGPVAATFDRAALFALPPGMRAGYVAQVLTLTGGGPQLLVSFRHGGPADRGPPFSVTDDEVAALYGPSHRLEALERDVEEPFEDVLWHLVPRG